MTQTYELYSTVDRLLQNLTIPKPGLLEFTPCTDDWTVEFIRHKKRTAYVIDNKCMVTITAIQEYRTDWEKLLKGQAVTVNFNDISEHFEVEVSTASINNIIRALNTKKRVCNYLIISCDLCLYTPNIVRAVIPFLK